MGCAVNSTGVRSSGHWDSSFSSGSGVLLGSGVLQGSGGSSGELCRCSEQHARIGALTASCFNQAQVENLIMYLRGQVHELTPMALALDNFRTSYSFDEARLNRLYDYLHSRVGMFGS